MKLLFVIPNLFRGGTEYQLLELCKSLQSREHLEQSVVTFHSEASMELLGYYDEVRALGVPVESLFDDLTRGIPLLKKLIQTLRRKQPDVVQSFLQANDYALAASLFGNFRLCLGIRNMINLPPTKRLFYSLLQSRVRYFVGNSKNVIDHFGGQFRCPGGKLKYIYNGIDPVRFRSGNRAGNLRRSMGIGDSEVVFVNVANMHFPTKGHRFLIDAFSRFAAGNPGRHLVLVGDGALRPELERLAVNRGSGNRIHFLGMRDDVLDVLSMADVYVGASIIEGFSNSIVEALLAGLPVIATDVGGTSEFVRENENGFLIPPGDSEAIYRALHRDYAALPRVDRSSVAELVDVDRLGRRYLELYT